MKAAALVGKVVLVSVQAVAAVVQEMVSGTD
jgi:hypothetical protein